jgi:hypothetical protein
MMAISKRTVLTAGAGFVVGMSSIAVAQAQGGKKSSEVATMGEGEAFMIGPKGERLHKSNVKVTAAQHEAARKKERGRSSQVPLFINRAANCTCLKNPKIKPSTTY